MKPIPDSLRGIGLGLAIPPKSEWKPQKPQTVPALPDWIPVGPWNDYLAMRVQIKQPMHPRAQLLAIQQLAKLRKAGHDPAAVLERSVRKGWQGLYPIPLWYNR